MNHGQVVLQLVRHFHFLDSSEERHSDIYIYIYLNKSNQLDSHVYYSLFHVNFEVTIIRYNKRIHKQDKNPSP